MCKLLSLLLMCTGLAVAQLPDFYKKVDRVFWIVNDVDKTLSGWRNLGYADANTPGEVETSIEFRGKTTSVAFEWAPLRLGNVVVDLIDSDEGDNAFTEFKKKHHAGIMALVHRAPSEAALNAEIERMKGLGVGVLQSASIPDDDGNAASRYVLFDTEAEGKYIVGLIYLTGEGEQKLMPPPLSGNPRRVSQFAFAVKELDSVSKYWTKLGWPEITVTHPTLTDLKYKGQPGKFDSKLGWQRHGAVVYEWILPLEGPSIYYDHMDKQGEGIQHVAFDVPDIDAASAEFARHGYPATQTGRWGEKDKPGSGRFAYHDLHPLAGIDVELLWNFPK